MKPGQKYTPTREQVECFKELFEVCRVNGANFESFLKNDSAQTTSKMSIAIAALVREILAKEFEVKKLSNDVLLYITALPHLQDEFPEIREVRATLNAAKASVEKIQSIEESLDAAEGKKQLRAMQILKAQPVAKRFNVDMILTTPEMAKALLECNIRNRRISEKALRKLAQDMTDSNWEPTPNDPVSILEDDGSLSNGQHRLAAIIKSGKPQYLCYLKEPISVSEAKYIDQGKPRNLVDTMHIQHHKKEFTKMQGSIIKLSYVRGESLTRAQINAIWEKHEELIKDVEHLKKQLPKGYAFAIILSAFFLAAVERPGVKNIPWTVIEEFVECVAKNYVKENCGYHYTAIGWATWWRSCGLSPQILKTPEIILNHTLNALHKFSKQEMLKRIAPTRELKFPLLIAD
jgi:hypothetical protein